ncbi:MAG TPA: putative metal-binding motif-containing protein, partial [Desulfosarcina sp.]|nr:putative metal-binding motif-containing protein [Desulfosarcina sp.]
CGDGIDQDCNGSDQNCVGEDVVSLSNGFIITFLEVVYNADGTSTWYYRVDETAAARDLSNWVLALPGCVQVVEASPSPYELVNPDPNANISGIKWETGDAFESGVFTIVLDAHRDVATVQVAAKGPDVALGVIAGPACTIIVPDKDQDGYTVADGDRDDNDPAIHPGAVEICGDGIDQDCDGSDKTCSATDVAELSNCYRITFLGVVYNIAGTSTWRYQVEEQPCAQDLSNWVLELPACVSVVNASPEPNELVNPDPNAGLSGIKWQTGAGFEIGIFEVTLNAHWEISVVNVAAKGPDVAQGEISGPSCVLVFVGQDEDGDGYTAAQGDCDDADSSIYPGAPEICEDGIDQDCSGEDLPCDALIDDDGDGFAEIDGDCDDTDAAINPDVEETCGDGIDQDCSGGDLACPTGGCDNLNIPAGALPPPGECKVWNPALEPGQQGPPVDCDCALVQPGTCLIDHNGNALSCI